MKSGYFGKEFLLGLPVDHQYALFRICEEFKRLDGSILADDDEAENDSFIETLSVMKAYCLHRRLKLDLPPVGEFKTHNIGVIRNFFNVLFTELERKITARDASNVLETKSSEYQELFSGVTEYVFSDQDFQRIQALINELRGLITNSNLLSDDHKRRMLRRLEAMQAELHKHTTDIDRFWGFIGEVGVAARKFGEDFKPISDRVQELGRIVVAVICLKEGSKHELACCLTIEKFRL